MSIDPFAAIKKLLAPINLCWYQHCLLAFIGVRGSRFAGFWPAIGLSAFAMLAETYKAFIYDRAHGCTDWRENWGDWLATLAGCLMGLML